MMYSNITITSKLQQRLRKACKDYGFTYEGLILYLLKNSKDQVLRTKY